MTREIEAFFSAGMERLDLEMGAGTFLMPSSHGI
jgi:hypothetical protein